MTDDRSHSRLMSQLVLAGIALSAPTRASAATKLSLAIPAPPHAFAALPMLVARDVGLFKHHGVDVDLIEMKSAAAATTAVAKGTIDLALAPTQFAVQIAANSKIPLKAIWGLNQADWILGTIDKALASCGAMQGATIGIDARRGPRWTQLNTMMSRGCNLTIGKDFKTVQCGTNLVAAMSSGQLKLAVLHLDEVKAIEARTGKQIHIAATLEAVAPGLHHLMLVARQPTIARHGPSLQRFVAAMRDASKFIAHIDNLKAAAVIARKAQGLQGSTDAHISTNTRAAKAAITALNAMSFYPVRSPGLDKARIEAAIANQIRIGKFTKGKNGIKSNNRKFNYNDIVDTTIWEGANLIL